MANIAIINWMHWIYTHIRERERIPSSRCRHEVCRWDVLYISMHAC